jgi:hypothetical protein
MNVLNLQMPHIHAHNTLKTLGKHSGSLGAYENVEKYKGGRMLFIGPEKQRTSSQGAYIRWFLPSGSMVASYVQVLSRGYSKSSVRPVVPHTSACTVCRAYIQRSSPYVCTTDNSIRPPNLAYICLKVQITPLTSLVTQNPN